MGGPPAVGRPRVTIVAARLAWLALPAAFWIYLRSVGVPLVDGLIALAYFTSFSLLPGLVWTTLLRPDIRSPATRLAYAAAIGMAMEAAMYALFLIAGIQHFFAWYLLVPAGLAALQRERLKGAFRSAGRAARDHAGGLLLFTVFAFATLSIGVMDAFTRVIAGQLLTQAAIAVSATAAWPVPILQIADVDLAYNYVVHLQMAAMHLVTGLPMSIVAARVVPALHFAVLIGVIFVFCRRHFRDSGLVAALVVVQIMWVLGGATIAGGVFGSAVPTAMNMIVSTTFGFTLFFVALDSVLAFVKRRGAASMLAAIIVLSFIGAGTRSALPPILICALLFAMVAGLLAGRPRSGRYAVAVAAVAGSFVAALVFFYRIHSDVAATSFLTITGHPVAYFTSAPEFVVPGLLTDLGIPATIAAIAAFAIVAAFQAGFLLPGIVYRLRSIVRLRLSELDLCLVGAAIAGVSAVFLTEAEGGSQFTFLHYAHFAMSLIGAVGLRRLLHDGRRLGWRPAGRWALAATAAALLLLQLGEAGVDLAPRWSQVVARGGYPQVWRRAKPTAVLDWLRENKEPNTVLLVVGDTQELSRRIVLEAEGIQLVGEPRLLRLYFDWSGRQQLRRRLEAVEAIEVGYAEHRILTAPLMDLAASLGAGRELLVFVQGFATADDPARLLPVAASDEATLYRWVGA